MPMQAPFIPATMASHADPGRKTTRGLAEMQKQQNHPILTDKKRFVKHRVLFFRFVKCVTVMHARDAETKETPK